MMSIANAKSGLRFDCDPALSSSWLNMRQMMIPPTTMNNIPKYNEKKLLMLISTNVQFTMRDMMIPNNTPTNPDIDPLKMSAGGTMERGRKMCGPKRN
jgi:hypothetical protein